MKETIQQETNKSPSVLSPRSEGRTTIVAALSGKFSNEQSLPCVRSSASLFGEAECDSMFGTKSSEYDATGYNG